VQVFGKRKRRLAQSFRFRVQELRSELAIQKIRPAGREATRQLQHQLLVSAAVGDLCVTSKSMTEGISTDGAFPTGNLIFDASVRHDLRRGRPRTVTPIEIMVDQLGGSDHFRLSRQIVQNRNNLRLGLARPRK